MRLLITSGPTREFIDPIRFLSNASSGKMGFAIAESAATRGHEVILIAGPVSLPTPKGVTRLDVISAGEMLQASQSHFPACDAAVMAAAVSDYRPRSRVDMKMERESGPLTLELEPTLDICAHLGIIKDDRFLMGFALEDHDHHHRAEQKLARKKCDAIVMNDPTNVGVELARVQVFLASTGWRPPLVGTKSEIAVELIRIIEHHLALKAAK